MIWLNDGSVLESTDGDQTLTKLSGEVTTDFVALGMLCGKIFNVLNEKRSRANDACEKYSEIFSGSDVSNKEFCSLCFNLAKICYFMPSQRDIRGHLIELVVGRAANNKMLSLLSDLAFHRITEFSEKYIENGGSENVLDAIKEYNEANTIEIWINEISRYQNSFSEFDQQFWELLTAKNIDFEGEDYLLSLFICNFIKNKKTTPDNLKKTAAIQPKPESSQDKVISAIIGYNFEEYITEVYNSSEDLVFAVHLLHLLSLKGNEEKKLLQTELDIAALRYIELIIGNYDKEKQTGLRQWAPSYMKIVNSNIRDVVKKIYPSISLGISGPYIQKIVNFPNFTYKNQKSSMKLVSELRASMNSLNNGEEVDLSNVTNMINELYNFCDTYIKVMILNIIGPEILKFQGLDGSVLSAMIDVVVGDSFDNNEEEVKNLCRDLQKMMFDVILKTGKIPEYSIK